MHIRPFGVEMWMNAHENDCAFNLAETCVDSLTIDELLTLADLPASTLDEVRTMRLSYGAIEGSDRLRAAVAALYRDQSADNVITTHGAAGANALVYATLVSPGDHVVSVLPTYQQHHSIPESYGALLDTVQLDPERGWALDLDHLASAVTADTTLIALTNPNNPTGAVIDAEDMARIAEIAESVSAWVLCDEVYRGVFPGEVDTPAITDLYPKGISIGSMSKAFSLAGLRLGWIAAIPELIEQVSHHRDYTHISVSMIDDFIATIAIEHADAVLGRSRELVRTNLAILDSWVAAEPRVSWVKPSGGTIALLKCDDDRPSEAICVDLLERTGVLLTPGSAMDMEGWLRIGYANATDVLRQGLDAFSGYLAAG